MKRSQKEGRNSALKKIITVLVILFMFIQCGAAFMDQEEKNKEYSKLSEIASKYEKKGDFKKAEKYYKMATDYNKYGYYKIAIMYYYNVNREKGIKKMEEAYNIHKVVDAANFLGYKAYEKNDIAGAKKWYTLAAKDGDSDAQYELARIYENEKKFEEAEKWYIEAAENNDSDAMYKVIFLNFLKGNKEKVKEWKRRFLGTKGLTGITRSQKTWIDHMTGSEKDEKYFYLAREAEDFIDESKYKEAEEKYIEAQKYSERAYFDLGAFYYYDVGDKEKGKKVLEEAYNRKVFVAAYSLGLIYESEKQPEEAYKWYKIAADEGDSSAQFMVALHYYDKKNLKEAEKYYILSADQKDAEAMYNLMLLYFEDKKDNQNAKKWANKILNDSGLENLTWNMKDSAEAILEEIEK